MFSKRIDLKIRSRAFLVMFVIIIGMLTNRSALAADTIFEIYTDNNGQVISTFSPSGTINGNVIVKSGTLDVSDNTLTVTGNLTIGAYGYLRMTESLGRVTVEGDFVIEGEQRNGTSELSAGEMVLKGDFTQRSNSDGRGHNNFKTSGSHTVNLAGSGEQVVHFDDPGRNSSLFTKLHISNESGEVNFSTQVSIASELTYSGDVLKVESLNLLDAGFILANDITIQSSGGQTTQFGQVSLSLNGHSLTVNGDLAFESISSRVQGGVSIDGGKLLVSGDFIHTHNLYMGGGQLEVGGDYWIKQNGHLTMNLPADRITVEGDFVMESGLHHGDLSDGELILKGDFAQRSSNSGGNGAAENFKTSGSHTVILAGTGEQVVHFDDSHSAHFRNLHISNESGEVNFSTQLSIVAGLTYSGEVLVVESLNLLNTGFALAYDITIQSSGGQTTQFDYVYLSLNGHTLTVNGDFVLESNASVVQGGLDIGGGKLLVSGDFIHTHNLHLTGGQLEVGGDYWIKQNGHLTMNFPADRITVEGDFVMESGRNHQGDLSDGEMILKGDFAQRSSTSGGNGTAGNFKTSGSHTVILEGSGEQEVRLDDPDQSNFTQLYINNPSVPGVDFTTAARVVGLFEHNGKQFTLSSAVGTNFSDYDGDGVRDHLDPLPQNPSISEQDVDGDGVDYHQDAFPNDPSESIDTDGDGIGNNADALPNNPSESVDTDNDGIGNNADPDDDGDGVVDNQDLFPLDKNESLDTDNDGVGNNADTDDDNDGMSDTWELANGLDPVDSSDASSDADGDNVVNLDEYRASTDPQSSDTDGDGVLDDQDTVVGTGLWGYACNVVNDPNSSTRRWGIDQYNLASLPNAVTESVYSMGQNRKIQSVACDPSGENILFSMKDSLRGDYEIYELDVASSLITQITDNDTDDVDVTRSRDGRSVAWQKRLADNRQAIELRRTSESGDYTYKTLASASPFVQPSLSPNGQWMTLVQLRPSFFAVMRYDIANNKYKEVKVIVRRKKLYHPSITDDGNKVGWTERVSLRRYRVKDMTENTTVDILNDASGIQHAVLSGDGEHVIYSINTTDITETYLTALETLGTQVVGETLNTPMRHLSSSWTGVTASAGFTTALVSDQQLTSYNQGQSFHFDSDNTGTRYLVGTDEAVDFTWAIQNGILVMTESSQAVWSLRLIAHSESQYTVSVVAPDEQGGTERLVDTLYTE